MNKIIIDVKTFSQRMTEAMLNSNETIYTLAEQLSLSPPTISRYLHGKITPKVPTAYQIAHIFNVNPLWLMGYDESKWDAPSKGFGSQHIFDYDNVFPLPATKKVPLVGTIACGDPIWAEENISEYIDIDEMLQADYCLRCKGDSMINARIMDGDIVFIKNCDMVEDGQIAVVLIDGEATLKRVYRGNGRLILQAENPAYQPIVLVGEELNNVQIQGKAVAFLSGVD